MSSFVTPHHLTYLMLILAFNFDYNEQSNIGVQNENQIQNQCKNEIENESCFQFARNKKKGEIWKMIENY